MTRREKKSGRYASAPRLVAIPIFPGLQSLDAAGPAQVFGSANQSLGREAYRIKFVAAVPGAVMTSAGFALYADSLRTVPAKSVDTLLCPGGEEEPLRAAARDKALMRWINEAAHAAKRACSVCSGAFLLASTGILSGRNAATHWASTAELQKRFPDITVDPESIYVTDGKCWTSAGVTTGIDMALALVEADHGREIAMAVARRLVVYMRRPGHQTQFSAALKAQDVKDDKLANLASWVEANLTKRLDVETLAARVAMSPRSFHRHMQDELKVSPAKFVESVRLDAARRWLDEAKLDLATVAARAGFSGPDHLIRAFARRFGVTPAAYRQIHGQHSALETRAAAE
ncbi:MAG: GlxA family transcriptional regulator [Alphaproteobacteria bacterium]|nr:GlxA family transcriptional regulator [Alphaproteobacteria bacterium]